MFLTRWTRPTAPTHTTYTHLFDFNDELNRLFSPFGGFARAAQLFDGTTPAVDIYEDKDSFTVKAELPGLKREDINISLEDGRLTVSGEHKSEEKQADAASHREERFTGRFERTIALPQAARSVKPESVSARYQDGILTVTLPKSEEVKPKSIQVTVK